MQMPCEVNLPGENMLLGGQEHFYDDVVTVSTTVSNSGSVDDSKVVQLYLSFPGEAAQPVRVLRSFEKSDCSGWTDSRCYFQPLGRDLSCWDLSAQR
jgi:beta-glucosidase